MQPTPEALLDRGLPTVDTLPPPAGPTFAATIDPLEGEALARSTWEPGCPVEPADLAYVTVSFWGFDDRPHTGELVVASSEAEDVVEVFRSLFDLRFPIEEMRIVTPDDLDRPSTGDENNTASYVCRAVTGGTAFSQHAYGLAIDINPFHNPYRKDDVVIPALASSYLDRGTDAAGVIQADGPVVAAFASIGWSWGGAWRSLVDYQHFSANGR